MNENITKSTLGIIAGTGDLPEEIARSYNIAGGNCYIASIIPNRTFKGLTYQNFPIGSANAILKYFKENSVKNIIIIGGIKRPELKSLKVDLGGSVLITKILKQKMLGDDNVLRVIADYIESKGFKVISPYEITEVLTVGNKIVSSARYKPSKQDCIDIEIGKKVINSLGHMDVGQSVIVSDGYVLGIEAAEGTDNLIKRCASLRKSNKGGVLVKMSKSGQDMRLDIPAIGSDTIKMLAKHNFRGVAIEDSGVIIVKPDKVDKIIKNTKLFLKII